VTFTLTFSNEYIVKKKKVDGKKELHGVYNNTCVHDLNGAFAKKVFSYVSLRRVAIYFAATNSLYIRTPVVYRSLLTSDRCGDPSLQSRRSSPSSISSLLSHDL